MDTLKRYIDTLPITYMEKAVLRVIINSGRRTVDKQMVMDTMNCTESAFNTYMEHLQECGVLCPCQEGYRLLDQRLINHMEAIFGPRKAVKQGSL